MGPPFGWQDGVARIRTAHIWNVWLLRGRLGTPAPMVLPRTRSSTPLGNFRFLYQHLSWSWSGSSTPARAKAEQATTTQTALSVPCLSGQVSFIDSISGRVLLLLSRPSVNWVRRARDYYPWLPPGALPYPGPQIQHQHFYEEFRWTTSSWNCS